MKAALINARKIKTVQRRVWDVDPKRRASLDLSSLRDVDAVEQGPQSRRL